MKSIFSIRMSAAILALLCFSQASFAGIGITPVCNNIRCDVVTVLVPTDLQPYYTSAQVDQIVAGLQKQINELQLRIRGDEGIINQMTNLNSGDNLRALVRSAIDDVLKTKNLN